MILIDKEAILTEIDNHSDLMTSIRGRRIRRLIVREFGSLERFRVEVTSDRKLKFVGESDTVGKACITNGSGKYAKIEVSILGKIESQYFDLLHDSLKLVEGVDI